MAHLAHSLPSSSIFQWVYTLSPSPMYDPCFHMCSITLGIIFLACTQAILAVRELSLDPDTESPPPYAYSTLPPYRDSVYDRNDYSRGSRRPNRRGLPSLLIEGQRQPCPQVRVSTSSPPSETLQSRTEVLRDSRGAPHMPLDTNALLGFAISGRN